ncbi:MAG TPA: CPBP family intramembrane glutamic endopeptidase [Roseiflexaceae bacterium]|nr:CPBP family intramembrane glutamic endopeptidase [Roseiflexaceae bacterium]
MMITVTAYMKRHPAPSYFALTFVISWGGMLLVAGRGGIPAPPELTGMQALFVMLAWFGGPSLASILLTGLLYGRAGFRDLLTRMVRWRVGARWYAVALLTAPLLFLAISLGLALSSPAFLPGILTSNDKAALLLFGLGYGLIGGGFLEELGWTGFATPTLLRRMRYGVLGTGLIVGVLWGALHFLVFFWMGRPSGGLPLALFLPVDFFLAVAGLTAFRVLMVWVYDRTESLLVAMLMHASWSAGTFILGPVAIAGVAFLTYTFAGAAVLWVVVAAVAVASRKQLSGQPPLRRRLA